MEKYFITVLLFSLQWSIFCEDQIPIGGNATDGSQKNKETEVAIKITMSGVPKSSTIRKSSKPPKLVCPGKEAPRPFFSIPCKVTKECVQLGNKNMLCCGNRCVRGIPPPLLEPVHSPTLFGLVERVCPTERIPEIFEIKRCTVDSDCSPRICCPEKMLDGDIVGYCRTAEPKVEHIPGVRRLMEPFRLMMSYMQCTPPPPPFLDVFPKECQNPLDCFPNLCCQERGKRYCRPPKRSLLTLLTTMAQRIIPSETARDIINRIAS